jgi:hypothetical protein
LGFSRKPEHEQKAENITRRCRKLNPNHLSWMPWIKPCLKID